jgi:hypothetical protein
MYPISSLIKGSARCVIKRRKPCSRQRSRTDEVIMDAKFDKEAPQKDTEASDKDPRRRPLPSQNNSACCTGNLDGTNPETSTKAKIYGTS